MDCSGKLEAIQESRKGGNVVTKSMLDAFLKTSPKYAGITTGLLASPVGLTTATAAIVGGILAQQLIKNDEIKNAHVNTSEIRKLLLGNIQSSKEIIARKKRVSSIFRNRLTKNNSVLMKQKDL